MAEETVGAKLAVRGRAGFSRDMKAAAGDVDQLGNKAESASKRAQKSSDRWRKFGKAAAAGIALAGAALVKFSVDAFKTYDAGLDAIRTGTGATGATLEQFAKNMESVGKRVTQPLDQVGIVLADLNTRTGMVGAPLELLTEQLLNLERIGNAASAENVTRVFGDWAIATDQASDALDFLYRASQATGPTVDRLSQLVVQFGAPMRQLGFDFEQSTLLLGKFEKEGVNTEAVMGAMRQGIAKMAKSGEAIPETFKRITDSIRDAKDPTAATAIAMELFGQRAGGELAAAIREGRFEIDELMRAVGGGGDTINKAAADTADFADKWAMLKNRATPYLAEFGGKLSDLGVRVIEFTESAEVKKWADNAADAFDWLKRNANWLIPVVGGLTSAFVAYKVAMVTVNTVTAVGNAIRFAHIASTQGLAAAQLFATGTTTGFAGATGVLNAVLMANPIGIVVAALALLTVGLVLAYQRSETFRNGVQRAFTAVKVAGLSMAETIVGVFRSMVNFYLSAVEDIVGGAAKAASALGMKDLAADLRAAQGDITRFKDGANKRLSEIETGLQIQIDTARAEQQIRNLGTSLSALTAKHGYVDAAVRQVVNRTPGAFGAEPRAAGGPVWPGRQFLVGEHGPELVVPQGRATVVPAAPTQRLMSARGGDGAGLGGGLTVHIDTINTTGDPDDIADQIVEAVKKPKVQRAIGAAAGRAKASHEAWS